MRTHFRAWAWFCICLPLSTVGFAGAPADFDSLLKDSPFGGAAGNSPVKSVADPLEFRGYMVDAGIAYFSIYETESKRSSWVTLSEKSTLDYVAKDYDSRKHKLTVRYQGNDLVLTLASRDNEEFEDSQGDHTARVRPMELHLKPLAGEAERMHRLVEEIERRRALGIKR